MVRTRVAGAVFLFAVVITAGCGGADKADSAHVAASTTTTTAAPTTTTPPTTTTTAPRQVPITPGAEPTFVKDGVTSRITTVEVVNADDFDTALGCASEVQVQKVLATSCLHVAWSFDVAPTFPNPSNGDGAGLTPGPFIGADHKEQEAGLIESGLPGTVDNKIDVYFPLTTPSSAGVLHWQTGSNDVGWTTQTYLIPNL
jgi:hypothetical protein